MITYRLSNLRKFLDDKKVNAVIINKLANVHYFSGFTGDSSALIITHKRNILVTDGRYIEQAESESPKFEIIEQTDGLWKKVSEVLAEISLISVGFEGNYLTVSEFNKLHELSPKLKLTSINLDELRQIKDETEIAKIEKACEIADKSFEEILKFIRPGIREIDIAAHLEHFMRKLGSKKPAFDTIVASGLRSTLPHGIATEKIIKPGEFVTMDFGAIYKNYNSDITRTIFVGRANEMQKKLYNSVLNAQLHGLKIIKPGISGKTADAEVRAELEKDGFEKYFIHGLGHGVGIEIHEEPRLSKKSTCEELKANMIVTDEPGVYIPNFGGVRIEDTILITDNGAKPLTKSPKNFIEINV
ncbi:MAG: aminopeptidase P family protein [Selenomonadaceae bacterium]|nr:aminopeptidase P family protein [Selenomonadaceae bacterium]